MEATAAASGTFWLTDGHKQNEKEICKNTRAPQNDFKCSHVHAVVNTSGTMRSSVQFLPEDTEFIWLFPETHERTTNLLL